VNKSGIIVTFFQVADDMQKKDRIVQTSSEYFEKKELILIKVPHLKALEFVDLLLWKYPYESFLPHCCEQNPTSDFIKIVQKITPSTTASAIFNLCQEPIENLNNSIKKIYELEDTYSITKNQSAQIRYKAYKNKGFNIIAI